MGISLDVVAKRYGVRPSSLMGMDPSSAQALTFDMIIAGVGEDIEAKASGKKQMTTAEQIAAKRKAWKV